MALLRCGGGGAKVASGNTTQANERVVIGFRPRKVYAVSKEIYDMYGGCAAMVYDEDYLAGKYSMSADNTANHGYGVANLGTSISVFGGSYNMTIYDDGFQITGSNKWYYVATV